MVHHYTLFAKNTNQHEVEAPITAKVICKSFKQKQLTILDVGCGSGLLLDLIIKKVKKKFIVDYIDPDKEIFKLFKKNMISCKDITLQKGFNLKLEQTIFKLTKKYDLILCGHSLYYSKLRYISQLIKLLKKSSILIIHISRDNYPAQNLFSSAIKKNSSQKIKGFLNKLDLNYERYTQKYKINVTSIKDYFDFHKNKTGKEFLNLFLYKKTDKDIIKKIKSLINNKSIKKGTSYYLEGVSDIYVIKNAHTPTKPSQNLPVTGFYPGAQCSF